MFNPFLSSLGISVSDCGDDFVVAVKKQLVSLSFSNSSQLVTLHYPGPSGFGQQSFSFDPQLFISAFNFSPFDELFFDEFYPKANSTVRNIFSLFLINPTVIRKVCHLNTNIHRRLFLKPSKSSVLKFLGLPQRRSSSHHSPSSVPFDDPLLIDIAKKAAYSFDLNLFDDYLSTYISLRSKIGLNTPLSPSFKKKLFSKFNSIVLSFQK